MSIYNCIYNPPLVSASHELFWGYQEILLWWETPVDTRVVYSLNMGNYVTNWFQDFNGNCIHIAGFILHCWIYSGNTNELVWRKTNYVSWYEPCNQGYCHYWPQSIQRYFSLYQQSSHKIYICLVLRVLMNNTIFNYLPYTVFST